MQFSMLLSFMFFIFFSKLVANLVNDNGRFQGGKVVTFDGFVTDICLIFIIYYYFIGELWIYEYFLLFENISLLI